MNLVTKAIKKLQGRSYNRPSSMSNIFGSIAGNSGFPFSTSADFIPLDDNGNILQFNGGSHNPTWLGLESVSMQYWAYGYCSPLAAVIDKLAEADTNGRIEMLEEETMLKVKNPNKNPRIKRLLSLIKNPNPFQTFEEFNSEQIAMCKQYGYCPVWAIGSDNPDKTMTSMLVNMNPYFFKPIWNDRFDIFSSGSNPIKEWKGTVFGKDFTIPSDNVILVKDGLVNSSTDKGRMGLPMSKIAGLDFFISNICASMEADNVLLKKKGPIGIFTHDPKPDMAGWVPLTPEQKKETQDEISQHGLSLNQFQHIVTKTPLKWNPMSFNLRDLMTKENVRQGADVICDRFGYPAELMSGKNATYENRESAEKYMYQNNIIPFSLRRMATYDKFFKLDGFILYLNYEHLPVLQTDIVKASQAGKFKSESLDIDWKNGMITVDEYRISKEMAVVGGEDGSLTFPDWNKKHGISLSKNTENAAPPKSTAVKE